MYWLLGAHRAPQDLNGSVGDDLVGVHVGLCTRAGLPYDKRKVVDELEGCDFGRCLLDGFGDLGVLEEVSPSYAVARSHHAYLVQIVR